MLPPVATSASFRVWLEAGLWPKGLKMHLPDLTTFTKQRWTSLNVAMDLCKPSRKDATLD